MGAKKKKKEISRHLKSNESPEPGSHIDEWSVKSGQTTKDTHTTMRGNEKEHHKINNDCNENFFFFASKSTKKKKKWRRTNSDTCFSFQRKTGKKLELKTTHNRDSSFIALRWCGRKKYWLQNEVKFIHKKELLQWKFYGDNGGDSYAGGGWCVCKY